MWLRVLSRKYGTTRRVPVLAASFLAFAFGLSLANPKAEALVAPPPEFEVVAEERADAGPPGTAPDAPVVESVTVIRGKGPQRDHTCTFSSSSGDGRGAFDVVVSIDATSEPLGYRFSHQNGTVPDGLNLPGYPITPEANGRIVLFFGDPKETREQPIDVTLSVTAVNRAGRESEPTEVTIEHDGSVDRGDEPQCDDGCALNAVSHGDSTPIALFVLAFALGLFGRRARHPVERQRL